MNLVALAAELTTDPLARGYSAMSDEQAANSLNAQNRLPDKTELAAGDIVAALVRAEYDALSAAGKAFLGVVLSAPSIPITAIFRTNMAALFAAGTGTRANLVATLQRSGSRADELLLGFVTPSDVADARRL